jgi:hypothetical protein
MWTLREAQRLKQAATWPRVGSVVEAIAGLQLWLDAAAPETLFDATTGGSLVAADGGVARWEDKSGNGRHATQATSGSRPLRKTSQQNGRDVLLFDGADDLLRVPYNASGSSGVTVFVVCKRFAESSFMNAFSNYEYSPGDGRGLLLGGGTSNAVLASGRPDGGADFKSASSGAATTNYVLATARWNGTSLFAYSNGGGESSVSAPSATFQSSDSVVLGGAYASDPSSIQAFYKVGIGEVIVYNSALSNTDRTAVELYLMSKWGIA